MQFVQNVIKLSAADGSSLIVLTEKKLSDDAENNTAVAAVCCCVVDRESTTQQFPQTQLSIFAFVLCSWSFVSGGTCTAPYSIASPSTSGVSFSAPTAPRPIDLGPQLTTDRRR